MPNRPLLLVAEDDSDDILMFQTAFRDAGMPCHLAFVSDGEQLLNYLGYTHGNSASAQMPKVVVLDLNMPRMDGRTALKKIRENPHLISLPVVILTTSENGDDKGFCDRFGAMNYFVKPITYIGWLEIVQYISSLCKETG